MIDKATQLFIKEHQSDDPRTLSLQAAKYPDVNMRMAATQIEGFQTAKKKLPTWAATEGLLYPTRLSMEQCSSEATARYKAGITNGNSITDLTGGFGIDCSYIARNFKEATYIERNTALCQIATHNFAQLGLGHINIVNADCEDIIPELTPQDWIFIDPARRNDAGKKVISLGDCEPNVCKLHDTLLQKSRNIMIKCSPMLDITLACRELPGVTEIHIIAVNNECKELLLILSNDKKEITTHCINIQNNHLQEFSYTNNDNAHPNSFANELGKYLYEPNAAIMKAACHKAVAARFGLTKLHPNSQLYTSTEIIENFPGRVFKIESHGNFSKSEIKSIIGSLKQANLAVRNFPEDVHQLRKRLKLTDGGEAYLFATTLADGKKVLIRCQKL